MVSIFNLKIDTDIKENIGIHVVKMILINFLSFEITEK